jgi:hypothetical protein
MDETSLVAEGTSLRVVVPKKFKKAVAKDLPHFNHHMTLILAISADGTPLPTPTVILPLTTLPALSDAVIDAFHYSGSETGWITIPIWSAWIVHVFIPYVNTKRQEMVAKRPFTSPQHGRALLFLDSHASRLDEYAHSKLAENGIVVVTIPSHSSHILQPLDCGVNNAFKHALRNLTFQKYIRMDGGLADYRHSLLYCVKAALSDAQNFLRIQSAFEVCGMWPWNPSRVTSDPTKVTPSLVVPPTPEKPTVTQNITGKVVTVAIIAEHRLRREEEDRIAELVKLARAAEKEEKVREREELTIAKAAAKALREVNAAKKRADKAARLAAKRKTPDPAQAPTATLTPVLPVPAAQSARKRAKKSL